MTNKREMTFYHKITYYIMINHILALLNFKYGKSI